MIDPLNVKVGDKVVYHPIGLVIGSIGGGIDRIVTVTKITPTGIIRVDYAPFIQFDKYGKAKGDYCVCLKELKKEV